LPTERQGSDCHLQNIAEAVEHGPDDGSAGHEIGRSIGDETTDQNADPGGSLMQQEKGQQHRIGRPDGGDVAPVACQMDCGGGKQEVEAGRRQPKLAVVSCGFVVVFVIAPDMGTLWQRDG
jgi:hypothetical protein